MNRRVDIRPPLLARIWVAGFSVFWCALLISSSLTLRGEPVGLAVTGGMLVFGVALAYRLVRLGAVAEGETLVLRNNFRTRRLTRSEIEGFRVGPASGMPVGRAIFVLLREQSLVQIDATMRLLPPGRRRLDRWLSELRDWLGEGQLA